MNYWWVNQNQTYKQEVAGGFLWSPKNNQNGNRNQFYENMRYVLPGDIVFSFCDTLIKAVGVVEGEHRAAPKPDEFGKTGSYWNTEGWFVPVNFVELEHPIKPKDYIDKIRETLPEKYSPLQKNGEGNQGVYLAFVPEHMASILIALLDGQVEAIEAQYGNYERQEQQAAIEEERILNDAAIQETEREQIIKARRGQGLFRSHVELIENSCRVTGVKIKPFLIASHIKPWAASSHREKNRWQQWSDAIASCG